MSFKLDHADRADIARLAQIHVDACAPDNAISVYFDSAEEFNRRVTEMLEGQVGRPEWSHMKATDLSSGAITAWASWVTIDSDTQTDPKSEAQSSSEAAAGHSQMEGPAEKIKEFQFNPGLGTFVQDQTDKVFRSCMGNKRHLQLRALFTDKPFERRGMATALIKYGNDLADKQKVPQLVQASPFGYLRYLANGFHVVGELDVDLRDYAPNAKGNDRGWGNYRYRFMLREPSST